MTMRTQDDRLRTAANTHKAATWWAAGLGAIALVTVAIATNNRHHHFPKPALIATGVLLAGAVLAYLISRWADGRIAYHSDRAFLARLYMASGFQRPEAERLADRKVRYDNRHR